ncbi:MAG: hypothetical protein GY830_04185 [Bacteroidetes bacterium]|nr:hypothetical protein [Bacteroidota bacterium]
MSRKTILISILFFGFPVFIFIGSYYYEFSIKKQNLLYDEDSYSNAKKTSLFHAISKNTSFSIQGNIINRFGSNKIEIRNLKISNTKTGELITRSKRFIKCLVHLGKNSIKIIEFMKLPIKENWEFEDTQILKKEISINENEEIIYDQKFLLEDIEVTDSNIEAFKEDMINHRNNGFRNLRKKSKQKYIKNFMNKLLVCAFKGDEVANTAIYEFEKYFKTKLKTNLKEWHKNVVSKLKLSKQK